MKRLTLIPVILYVMLPLFAAAQQKKTANTAYNFTEAWVWEYNNASGNTSEIVLYREPKSNYWLLTPEAYGNTDEMCDWILVQPDGTCYFAYKDAELGSGGTLLKMKLHPQKGNTIPTYWKATNQYKKFGNTAMGFPVFNGKEYKVSYLKTNEQSVFYLATTKANFAALSLFNELDIDAKLPVRFPKDIPGNYVPLSENSSGAGYKVQYNFKYVSHTEYHINTGQYKLRN